MDWITGWRSNDVWLVDIKYLWDVDILQYDMQSKILKQNFSNALLIHACSFYDVILIDCIKYFKFKKTVTLQDFSKLYSQGKKGNNSTKVIQLQVLRWKNNQQYKNKSKQTLHNITLNAV